MAVACLLRSVRVVNGEGGPRRTMHKKTGFNRARQKESRQAEFIYQVIRYAEVQGQKAKE